MGRLILFGNLLGEGSPDLFAPHAAKLASELDGIIGESDKGARRFLAHFRSHLSKPIHHIPVALFRKKTDPSELNFLLEPIEEGQTWGYVTDCGLPCLADPGHLLVRRCAKKNIAVEACLGPSSITHALVLSGFDGNRFYMRGYLPKEPAQRALEVQRAEACSKQERSVQIYIEAPYRSAPAVAGLIEHLKPETHLCIARNLTLPGESVQTKTVAAWRERTLDIGKEPTVFLINA